MAALVSLGFGGCGGGGTTSTSTSPPTVSSVTPSCNPATLQLPAAGSLPTSQCSASVQGTGNFSSGVTWSVSAGSISTSGIFTPLNISTSTKVTITATSVQNTTKVGTTTISVGGSPCPSGGQPAVILNAPAPGAGELSGYACNVNTTTTKVVIYALTNQWYVQPFVDEPFTDISSDGSWSNGTNPWNVLVILLVNPANYAPAATEITNPALDANVIAWTMYPVGPVSVEFGGRIWGIKMTGNDPSDQFDPGPNFWSNDPSVVNVGVDGLHLNIVKLGGNWQCGEVYLTKSLGYGTYTVQVASRLDQLNVNTVAAPLFIYAAPGQELDNEYSGMGGLIPAPYNAQFVVQPYNINGNLVQYLQPADATFTTQMEWRVDHVAFTTWNGWAADPAPSDIIYQWTYTGGIHSTPRRRACPH